MFQGIKTKPKYLSVVQEALSFSVLHLRFLNILELLLHWFFTFFFFIQQQKIAKLLAVANRFHLVPHLLLSCYLLVVPGLFLHIQKKE